MCTCVVAGGGELLDGFRAQPARPASPSASTSSAPSPTPSCPAVLRAADLFLLTTEPPESFGIVLIEAMACGLPAIATDYPGVRAVVDEGETGLLVPAGDASAVAGALGRARGRRDRPGGPRWAQQGGRRPSATGAGRALLDRMDAAYAEAIAARGEGAQ